MQPDAANTAPTRIQDRLTRHAHHARDRIFPQAETVFGREPTRHSSHPAWACNLRWRREDCMAGVAGRSMNCRRPEIPGTRAAAMATTGTHRASLFNRVASRNGNWQQDLALSRRTAVQPGSRCAATRIGRCLCSGDSGASSTNLGFAPASDPDFTLSLRQWSGSG